MKWFVEIIEYKTDSVVHRIECASERLAEKCDAGANRNLDHANFYTRIVPGA